MGHTVDGFGLVDWSLHAEHEDPLIYFNARFDSRKPTPNTESVLTPWIVA
jgi:hypothetical protein